MRGTILLALCALSPVLCAQDVPSKSEAKARAYLAKDKPYKAIALCNDHLDRGTVEARYYVVRADAYNHIGEHAKAEQDARRARAAFPSSVEALLQLGVAEQGQGRNDSALAHLQQVLGQAPSAEAWFHLALTHQQRRDAAAALDALSHMGSSALSKVDQVRVHRLRGECLSVRGDTAAASRAYDSSLVLAPRDPVTWNSRGFHRYASFGEHARAVQDYDRAIKLNPNYSYAFNNRGWSQYKLGQRDKALKDIDLALRKKPTNAFAYRNLGVIRLEQGDTANACRVLRQAQDLGYAAVYGNEVDELVARCCPTVPSPAPPVTTPRPNAPSNTPSNAPAAPAKRTNAP